MILKLGCLNSPLHDGWHPNNCARLRATCLQLQMCFPSDPLLARQRVRTDFRCAYAIVLPSPTAHTTRALWLPQSFAGSYVAQQQPMRRSSSLVMMAGESGKILVSGFLDAKASPTATLREGVLGPGWCMHTIRSRHDRCACIYAVHIT
jgi:hypothetical protein